MKKIKILVVEDHHLIRASFRALLEKQPELEVVGETDNGAEAIDLAQRLSPNIVLMDIMLRDSAINGTQATREITRLRKDTKVIALSVMDKIAYVKGMLSAGASGYLSKNCTEEELMAAIETVMQDKPFFGKIVDQIVREEFIDMVKKPAASSKSDLTGREQEVLRLTALGQNSKEIAGELELSPKTVHAHLRSLKKKLKLNSTADLIKYAIREKVIEENE